MVRAEDIDGALEVELREEHGINAALRGHLLQPHDALAERYQN